MISHLRRQRLCICMREIMTAFIRPFCFLLALLAMSTSARAEQQDIAAAARGVVRVAVVATDGSEAYFVGHGSGVAIAPDKVLTNAHVVELVRQEKNLVIGVVPSEGRKSHGGHIIAFSPGNDLALIQLDEGSLPPATFYAGAVNDGQHVTAIGYPGNVDRAQGLGLRQMVEPLGTVKTSGNVSAGRSSQSFDTILHTAPLAAGNSGGPLVDDCGRVLGINSFGSISDGNDAEFGFAVSYREIVSFLRQAGVSSLRTVVPCRSMAEADAAEATLTEREAQQQEQSTRAMADAQEAARDKAHDAAERDILSERENAMAAAAVLLALAVLGFGAAGLNYSQGKKKPVIWFSAGGGVLLVAALAAFLLKPSFDKIEERMATPQDKNVVTNAAYAWAGDNICRVDLNRSRITVSQPNDIPFHWAEGGCANGDSQFVSTGDAWQRSSIPTDAAYVATTSFYPASGALRTQRWLPDADTMDKVRALLKDGPSKGCTSDDGAQRKIATLQSDIMAILPGQPNERLVYHCQKGLLAPKDTKE